MQTGANDSKLEAANILSSVRIERIDDSSAPQLGNLLNDHANKATYSVSQGISPAQSRIANNGQAEAHAGICGLTLRDSRGNIHSLLTGGLTNDPSPVSNFAANASISNMHSKTCTATNPPFNIWEAMCEHEDIIFYFATQHLEPHTFLKMYSISRRFFAIVSTRMTTFMLSSARRWAFLKDNDVDGTQPTRPGEYRQSDITTLLPFHHYKNLCMQDLTRRQTSSGAQNHIIRHISQIQISGNHFSMRAMEVTHLPSPTSPTSPTSPGFPVSAKLPRSCPSFRYLFFCVDRATTARSIVATMRTLEHRLPSRIVPTLIKLGYVLDLPTNFLRQAIFHNREYWTDLDIRLLCLFCLKLDMAFTDPVDGEGEALLRMMMLAQKSLTVLLRVLRREQCRDFMGMLKMYVKWRHKPLPEHRQHSILGIPPQEIGALEKEYWGKAPYQHPGDPVTRSDSPSILLRPDELTVMEGVRRELELHKSFLYFMISGYIDPVTLNNYTDDAEVVL